MGLMKRYNPKEIEPKWQQKWAADKIYQVKADDKKTKIYATPMLPYPSGSAMHTGHVRNYAIADVVARFYRQRGYNTLSTMGWDAFGLPAENYAIKTGTPPAKSTADNTVYFKKQLQALAMSYDWSREFTTSDPSYYKWTQWVFGLMYNRGLAYKAEKDQWWCQKCNTVLADEQVVAGKCWRHDGPDDQEVNKKKVSQWFFKITDYAERILAATDDLAWPEKIKTMQKNWIGKSVGAEVDFLVAGSADSAKSIKVFTTRPDTLFGATFMVLAPEHPLVEQITTNQQQVEVQKYVGSAVKKDDIERQAAKQKTGVFTGAYAINPVNGTKIPIWIADYVLMGYGTGAIMAVPAHDDRDYEFAQTFDLPIIEVINTEGDDKTTEGVMKNSASYDGMESQQAREQIVADLAKKGAAAVKVNYKIRDWLISRQRYWGAPVPIIYCPDHGAVLVPDKDLPVQLPEVDNYVPDGQNSSVLAGVKSWVNAPCPTCGKPGKRETDTMDGYVCSTWYLHRYTDPQNDKAPFDSSKLNYWFPVDFYFGGDHAVAHLLYVRFFQKVLHDAGLANDQEPIKRLVYNGYINAQDGRKMSKSLGNTVDPMDIIDQGYGADSLRLFELFIAPYDQDTSWNTNGVPGTFRFLQRFWTLVQDFIEAEAQSHKVEQSEPQISSAVPNDVLKIAHQAIKKVSQDIDALSFNTAVSALMEAVNALYKLKNNDFAPVADWRFALESLTQLLAPFAPYMTEELWHDLGHDDSIHKDHWPVHDESYLVADTINIAVQVNGKLRGEINMPTASEQQAVIDAAKADKKVQAYIAGKAIKREIYVPGKLVNLVV